MKTAEEIFNKKFEFDEEENSVDYSGENDYTLKQVIIEAMEEYASQFSATVKVTECSFKSQCEQFDTESKKQFCGCFNSSSEVSKTDAIEFAEWLDDSNFIKELGLWYDCVKYINPSNAPNYTTSELYTLFLQSNTK